MIYNILLFITGLFRKRKKEKKKKVGKKCVILFLKVIIDLVFLEKV